MPPQQRKEAESTLHTKRMPQTKRGCPSPATAAACAQPPHISVIHIAVHINYTQTSPELGLFQVVLNVASTNVFESSCCCQWSECECDLTKWSPLVRICHWSKSFSWCGSNARYSGGRTASKTSQIQPDNLMCVPS